MNKFNLRLDERTERELSELVEHYTTKQDGLGLKVTASAVVRAAIHELYETELVSLPRAQATRARTVKR